MDFWENWTFEVSLHKIDRRADDLNSCFLMPETHASDYC
jgi:hypothetical protein